MHTSKSSPSRITTSNYSLDEVIVLVEEYAELSNYRHKPYLLVRLADLDITLRRLSRAHTEAIVLCGFASLSARTAGRLVGVSAKTMRKRYWRGLRELTKIINGGKLI